MREQAWPYFAALLKKIKEAAQHAVTIIDNLITQDSNAALSANMGYELNQMIRNSWDGSKYLSLWNATTGKPVKDPVFMPYEYETGMFFIVGIVAEEGETNYRPSGTEYTGEASTEEETDTLVPGQKYRYNGTEWELQEQTSGDVSFAQLTGDPEDNSALEASLNGKVAKDTGTSTYAKAYIKNADGTQDTKPLTRDAYANSIVARDANNRFAVGSPSASTDAVNKDYADKMLNMSGTGTYKGVTNVMRYYYDDDTYEDVANVELGE